MAVSVRTDDFDIAAEIAALTAHRTDIGAVVTFTGICRGRDDGRDVCALTLETYEEMEDFVESVEMEHPKQFVFIFYKRTPNCLS